MVPALLVMALAAGGCIVPEAPDYDPPRSSAPILNAFNANPSLRFPVEIKTPTSDPMNRVPFNIQFKSEDAGDWVWAGVYLDYGNSQVLVPNTERRIPPATLDHGFRDIPFSIKGDPPKGCHTLTLFVTHLANTKQDETGETILDETKAQGDLGVVTWFLNVDAPDSAPTTLDNCPTRGGS